MPAVTEEHIRHVIDSVAQEEFVRRNALPQSGPLSDRDQALHDAQECRRRQRIEALEKLEARIERARGLIEVAREQRYAENAPARTAALAELEQLEPTKVALEESLLELRARERVLTDEVDRHAATSAWEEQVFRALAPINDRRWRDRVAALDQSVWREIDRALDAVVEEFS